MASRRTKRAAPARPGSGSQADLAGGEINITDSLARRAVQALFSGVAITSPSTATTTVATTAAEPVLPRVAEARLRDLEARAQLCRGGPEPEPRVDRAATIASYEFASARRRRGRA